MESLSSECYLICICDVADVAEDIRHPLLIMQ